MLRTNAPPIALLLLLPSASLLPPGLGRTWAPARYINMLIFLSQVPLKGFNNPKALGTPIRLWLLGPDHTVTSLLGDFEPWGKGCLDLLPHTVIVRYYEGYCKG